MSLEIFDDDHGGYGHDNIVEVLKCIKENCFFHCGTGLDCLNELDRKYTFWYVRITLTHFLVRRGEAQNIADYLVERGIIYTTSTYNTYYPKDINIPDFMIENVQNYIVNNQNVYGVSDNTISEALNCK